MGLTAASFKVEGIARRQGGVYSFGDEWTECGETGLDEGGGERVQRTGR